LSDLQHNPLKPIKTGADVFVGIMLLLFLAVSALVLAYGTSSNFQRLGSLWVAILLLSFGLLKYMVVAIRNAVEGTGPFAEMARERLRPYVFSEDKGWLNYMSEDGVEYETPLPKQEEVEGHFAEIEQHILSSVIPNEMIIGALATLQWGYGDLFHCWINGKGWTTC
jgi:hypothetical protein